MSNSKKRVLVGLSGGVDSSVAALILKKEGYDVIGVTMEIWKEPKNAEIIGISGKKSGACFGPDEKEDIEAASKIAKQLDIPYYTLDCRDEYAKIVLENFKTEYGLGKTPNPCIWCNALVKFGALPRIAREKGIEFDKFATGHYARVQKEGDFFSLKTAILGPNGEINPKDQSYFLYRLTQNRLQNVLLPLGNYSKAEIREIALQNGLKTAEKADSQDFYAGNYNELLNFKEKTGNIIDTNGRILGTHKGFWNFTPGQRKGLNILKNPYNEPLYVLNLNPKTNEVAVGPVDKTFKKSLSAENLSWIIKAPNAGEKLQAKIRSNGKPFCVTIKTVSDKNIEIEFEDYQKITSSGQSVVLYDRDTVLGGGIINDIR